MKTSKIIVAINSDKDAPIFNKYDNDIIGNIFKIVPALTAELATKNFCTIQIDWLQSIG